MVAARWDEGCELVRADFGEGSCVGSLLAVPSPLPWTREHRAAQPRLFLRKKQKKKFSEKYLVGCRCFVSLIHRGQLEFCQRE